MSIRTVMTSAANKIKPSVRKELKAQGHYLTGALENSLNDNIVLTGSGTTIEGTALYYAKFVNEGFPAASANWSQFPFLIKYFKARGLSDKDAKGAAAGTIRKWMKEGMPTEGSKKYSRNGKRLAFLKAVKDALDNEIDAFITLGLDNEINKEFIKTKSETI